MKAYTEQNAPTVGARCCSTFQHRQFDRFLYPIVLIAIAALLIGPCLIWNFSAFVNNTLLYAGGALETLNYPIRGFTFGSFLLATGTGQIASPQAKFPFGLFQLIGGLPVMLILVRNQLIKGQLRYLFLNGAFFIIVFGFFLAFFKATTSVL